MSERPGRRSRRGGLLALGLLAGTVLVGVLYAARSYSEAAGSEPRVRSGLDSLTCAKAALIDRDLARAESLVRELLSLAPRHREARSFLARVLIERGRLVEARQICLDVLQEDPDHVEATLGLADVASALGQDELAVGYLQGATKLRPGDPTLWKALGSAQSRADDRLGALSSFQQSLALDPGQADVSRLLSELVIGKPEALAGLKPPGRAGPVDAGFPPSLPPGTPIPRPGAQGAIPNVPKAPRANR